MVASRIASRLAAVPAPRWGPPLLRTVIASRIANRLLPPDLAADEETKDDGNGMDATRYAVDEESKDDDVHMADETGEWLLRFDGACRANPGPGGAGAALFKPSGTVVWTCSHYMPSSSETNNTAEYTALLLGTRAAADHGVTRLRVEGDSTLVIQQVRGIFAARSTRLRALRNQVKSELARVGSFSLHHIDRQANAHADRLANRGLDLRRTVLECGVHADGAGCTDTTIAARSPLSSTMSAQPTSAARPDRDDSDDTLDNAALACGVCGTGGECGDCHVGDIEDGEVYTPMRLGPGAVPARRPRLRLRKLTDKEQEEAGAIVERLGARLAAKIADASDWESAESYITALPYKLYEALQPYS
jgi:ribonuclease HI